MESYANHHKGWLLAYGRYADIGYYLLSTLHRFLCVGSLCRRLESEAIYLDTRTAAEDDLTFLKTTAAISWVMTDVVIFEGLPYDDSEATDHFFADDLRKACDSCYANDNPIEYDALEDRLARDRSLDGLIAFFDGLIPDEARYRWDRMVALHLFIVAFINKFGYREQRTTGNKYRKLLRNSGILRWLQT